ncbi:MAG: exonuclease domain-containing protein [Clostridia bacterium]|nr:exonuclease domain-containing protein [Clostridia bacterium]
MSKYVIVDLEMCNVPKRNRSETYHLKNELIQIGAVVVDESLEITDEFMTFVAPEFGVVDAFIEKLTGISKKDVDGAPCIKEALEMFLSWLPDDAVLVSWSDSDEAQIRKETEAKGIAIENLYHYLETWLDCQKTFSEKMDAQKNYRLSEALIIADIDYDEGAHDALVDAKNTARLFIKMEREPELVLSPYYCTQCESETYNPFAALLANYSFAG